MDEKVHNALMGRNQGVSDPEDVKRLMAILAQMGQRGGQPLTPLSKLRLARVCADAKMYDTAMPLFEAAVRETFFFLNSRPFGRGVAWRCSG